MMSQFLDTHLLDYELGGAFFDIMPLDGALIVSREYEHFVVGMDVMDTGYWQSALQVPHPSGMFFDQNSQRLYLSSIHT